MKKQNKTKKTTKKVKVVKAKSKTLNQRIEALKALKVRRQKLSSKIDLIERKLVQEVRQMERQIESEPVVHINVSVDPLSVRGYCDHL